MVDIADPLGNTALIRLNHLHPPFNDVRARRAILMAISQEDFMRAIVDDDKLWKPMFGLFTPGTPLYNDEGGEILRGPRNFDGAKRLLAQSGYANQPVTCLVAQDMYALKAFGEVTADVLKRLGINTDFVATDWGTVVARRAQKSQPALGGWHMFPSWSSGLTWFSPAINVHLRANGDNAWFGWPNSPQVEAEIAAWFDAKMLDEEKRVARRINKAALDDVVEIPLGFWLSHQAWRKNVTGIVRGPLRFFWGVSKAV
jgi:peptide/nickel transport system substrate-binding protein